MNLLTDAKIMLSKFRKRSTLNIPVSLFSCMSLPAFADYATAAPQTTPSLHSQEVTPSARGCSTKKHGPYATVDFIYWQAKQDEMYYAVKNVFTHDRTTQIYQKPELGWAPGFKAGIGYNLPYDGWDIYLNWTWLNKKHTTHIQEDDPNTITTLYVESEGGSMPPNAESASSRWNLRYNTLDLELGRKMFLSRRFSIRPQVGLRAASLNQHLEVHYSGLTNPFLDIALAKSRNQFDAIGPRFGLDTRWGSKWAMFGNISTALLFGEFDVKESSYSGDGTSIFAIKDDKHRLRPTLQMILGVDWGTCIRKNYYIKFSAGYEIQYWWAQWQTPNGVFFAPVGDLMLHGLTAEGRFEF